MHNLDNEYPIELMRALYFAEKIDDRAEFYGNIYRDDEQENSSLKLKYIFLS